MEIDVDNLFEGIHASLNAFRKQTERPSQFDRILKFRAPKNIGETNNYLIRLLPYVKEGQEGLSKTFFHYNKYFWKDDVDPKRNHNILSLKTFNQNCPVNDYYFRVRQGGNQWEKERLKGLKFQQGWYTNVYVVSDPVNPENNGKVMALSLNQTLYTIVQRALDGELDADWSAMATAGNPEGKEVHINVGHLVHDLSDKGVNLKVAVKKQGDFPNYSGSMFTREGAQLHLTQEQKDEILNSCLDTTKIEKVLTRDEIISYFKKFYLHADDGAAAPTPIPESTTPAYAQVAQQSYQPTPAPAPMPKPEPVVEAPKPTPEDIFGGDEIPGLESTPAPKPQQVPDTEADMKSFLDTLSKGSANPAGNFNFN